MTGSQSGGIEIARNKQQDEQSQGASPGMRNLGVLLQAHCSFDWRETRSFLLAMGQDHASADGFLREKSLLRLRSCSRTTAWSWL